MASAAELKAIAKVLEVDHDGEATSKDVALLIIEALDQVREKTNKFMTVGLIGFPLIEKDNVHLFGVGPFTTELQATRAGEAFAYDPKTKTGSGKYWTVPLMTKGRDAWDAIRPSEKTRAEWIKDSVYAYIHNYDEWERMYKDKGGW